MSCTNLAVVLYWGTETSERVPTSLSDTRHPLIVGQNRHFLATGIITNKHSTREVFPENGERFIEENVSQRFDVLLERQTPE